jgi:hypothetical protein
LETYSHWSHIHQCPGCYRLVDDSSRGAAIIMTTVGFQHVWHSSCLDHALARQRRSPVQTRLAQANAATAVGATSEPEVWGRASVRPLRGMEAPS